MSSWRYYPVRQQSDEAEYRFQSCSYVCVCPSVCLSARKNNLKLLIQNLCILVGMCVMTPHRSDEILVDI